MTDDTRSRIGSAARIIVGVASVLGLVYFGIVLGETRQQLADVRDNLHTAQLSLASEINRSTGTDFTSALDRQALTVKLDDILRRLDRIEKGLR